MIQDVAAAVVGLCGGAICGLSLRGARVMAAARLPAVVLPLAMLTATVMLSCAAAWTFFTEYIAPTGWYWLGAGLIVGLVLGEVAFRLGIRRRNRGRRDHQPPMLETPRD